MSYLTYSKSYVNDVHKFYKSIVDRTIIPHQLELQPGPNSSKICWMDCPYCYGINSLNSSERLSLDRYLEIIAECSKIPKIIFSGYATDPLFYKDTPTLIKKCVKQGQTVGIHSKVLKLTDALIDSVIGCTSDSYISISLDAYDNETYSLVHNYPHLVYDKILENIKQLSNETNLLINVNYLVTEQNNFIDGFFKMYQDVIASGADCVRFSVAQSPKHISTFKSPQNVFWGSLEHLPAVKIYKKWNDEAQITPCWARWLFPTISFDGYLARCCETASPSFSSIRLGNLKDNSFWDLYYDYTQFDTELLLAAKCQCDRKSIWANQDVNSRIGSISEKL